MDILDRASFDLGGRKTPATIEGELAEPAGSSASPARSISTWSAREVAAALAEATPARGVTTTIEQKHLTLSRWQTFGAVIVVLAIVVGAFGMATYGYVAARDWGCKTGAFQSGCPVDEGTAAAGRHSGLTRDSIRAPLVHCGPRPRRSRALTSACEPGNMARDEFLSGLHQRAQAQRLNSAPPAGDEQ